MAASDGDIEDLEDLMMQAVGRPAGSLMELIERLVILALVSIVTCCLIVVEGITNIAGMTLRCAAAVLIVLVAAACLSGLLSMPPWSPSEFPRASSEPLPPIEVESGAGDADASAIVGGKLASVCERI